MKISVSNIAWDRSEDDDIVGLLQKYNVLGIDVALGKISPTPDDLSDQQLKNYKKFWHSNNINLIGMQSMLFGKPELTLFEDESTRKELYAHLVGYIQMAAKLGIKPLVFGSPKNRRINDLDFDKAFEIAADFFIELAEYAYQLDTIICFEPNPIQYNCDFINRVDEAIRLVEQVSHPAFKLNVDSAIMAMNGEDVKEVIYNAREHIAHFHISEENLGVVKDDKFVNHQLIANSLQEIAYDGWLCIEMRGGWTSPNTVAVEEALDYVTRIYC